MFTSVYTFSRKDKQPVYALNPINQRIYNVAPLFYFLNEINEELEYLPEQAQKLLDHLVEMAGEIDTRDFQTLSRFLIEMRDMFTEIADNRPAYKLVELSEEDIRDAGA